MTLTYRKTQRQQILECLQSGSKTTTEIQEACRIEERGVVRGRLSELKADGLIVKRGSKFHIITKQAELEKVKQEVLGFLAGKGLVFEGEGKEMRLVQK